MQDSNHRQKFIDYVALCNQALAACNKAGAFIGIIKVIEDKRNNTPLRLFMSGSKDGLSANLVLVLKNCRLEIVDPQSVASADIASRMIDFSYVSGVLAKPELYIRNPARLDWKWLQDPEDSCCCGAQHKAGK